MIPPQTSNPNLRNSSTRRSCNCVEELAPKPKHIFNKIVVPILHFTAADSVRCVRHGVRRASGKMFRRNQDGRNQESGRLE